MKLCRFRQLEKAANNERLGNDCEFNIISLRPDPKRRRPSLRKRRRFYLWVGIKPLSHLGLAQLEGLYVVPTRKALTYYLKFHDDVSFFFWEVMKLF